MATKKMKVMPMLMGIVTTVFISFGFSEGEGQTGIV